MGEEFLTTPRASALPTFASGSAPKTIPSRLSSSDIATYCPAEPFAITFAPLREWLRVKITSLPERISPRGFKVLSSIQVQ